MQLKITLNNFFCTIILFAIVSSYQIDGMGYSNVYAINKLSNQSLIKLPFRLLSYNLSISEITSEDNFSIKANFGIEHKINNFDSKNSLMNMLYDLISFQNVDYDAEFRELYFSLGNSISEIRIGKQLHSWGAVDANSPLDFLNPTDYYYLFTDSDETKIGKLSFLFDLYFRDSYKFQLLVIPEHTSNNIPLNDPDFPIALPATVQDYQFLNNYKKPEIGACIQKSFNNMDWSLHYFSGFDRNYNLYGANVFLDDFDINSVTDTVFSFRQTDMVALSNVSFIDDLTIRSDIAYFKTNSGNHPIESRLYSGKDPIAEFLNFETLAATSYFNISAEYYQYCFQLEYGLPLDINFTTQLFGYEKIIVSGNIIDIELTNFEIYLDGKDFFYPGLGSPLATLAEKALVINLDKRFNDELMELQFVSLIDLENEGKLFQLKYSYDIIDDLNISVLYYKGIGNKDKYPDNPDTETINESLLYPFNGMEDFSHIRAQLKYFF
tara:strand:- start:7156 stop:8637 length:1482 start_codon:yes stop_codon:yes gene_type:complete